MHFAYFAFLEFSVLCWSEADYDTLRFHDLVIA